MAKTKLDEMRGRALRVLGAGCTKEEVERYAKHLFARHLSGGATIGGVVGKLVIERELKAPLNLPDRKPKASSGMQSLN